MKKLFIAFAVFAFVMLVAAPAFAHPPIDRIQKPSMPEVSATGLHKACGNLTGSGTTAEHVFYKFLLPHPLP